MFTSSGSRIRTCDFRVMRDNPTAYTFDLRVGRFRVTRRSSSHNSLGRKDLVIGLYIDLRFVARSMLTTILPPLTYLAKNLFENPVSVLTKSGILTV